MKTLHRASGRFTVLKGTDRLLHFIEAIPNAIQASTDLYEVVLFRALRRGVRNGTVTSIDADGSSFYLLVASMLHRLATRKSRPIERIRHLNAKVGAEFEGLKLLAETRKTGTVWFDALFPNRSLATDFDILHRKIERAESPVRLGETRVSNRYVDFRRGRDCETIDLIDWFKEHPVPLDAFLAERFAPESQTQRLLAIVRCGWDERIDVRDLFDEQYTLPSMADIRGSCAVNGLHASALFLQDFDRDFLLPFDGAYGLALLYVTRDGDDVFSEAGFRPLADDVMGQQRAVVTVDHFEQPRSYDSLFSAELPALEEERVTDWSAWKTERDWDPGLMDWKAGPLRGDAMIIPIYGLGAIDQFTTMARALLADDPADPWLSAEGLIYTAFLLRQQAPLESFHAAFTALDRAAENSRRVGYIWQMMRHVTVKEFSENAVLDLEEGPPLSLTEATTLLSRALSDAGWLESTKDQESARMALRMALKETPERLAEAMAGLDQILAYTKPQ